MEDEERIGFGPVFAVIVGIAIAVGASLYRSFSNPYGMVDLAFGPLSGSAIYLMGQATIFSLAVFAVIWLVYLRWRDEQRTLTYFLVTLVSVFVLDFGVFAIFHVAVHSAEDERQATQMIVLTLGMADSELAPPPATAASGDIAVVEQAVLAFASEIRAASAAYHRVVKETDFPGFTKAKRVAADRGLVETEARLKRLHAAAAAYRAAVRRITAAFPAKAAALDVRAATRNGLLKQVAALITRQGTLRDQEIAAEDDLYGEFDAVMALLAHPRGRWLAEDRGYMFYNEHDLEDFETHMAEVTHLGSLADALSYRLRSGA
jgi:hypothetical protein